MDALPHRERFADTERRTGTQEQTGTAVLERPEEPHDVLLWNDPVNIMEMVVHAITRIFGYSVEKAETLMQAAHNDGKVVVWSGSQERCVGYAHALHAYGLQATVSGGGQS